MATVLLQAILCGFLGQRALAAPLAPSPVQTVPFTFDVTALLSADQLYLRAPGCEGDACTAIRHENMQGGEASLWLIPQLGLYGGGAHDVERTAAATYTGDGYSLHAGVKGGGQIRTGLGVYGWVSVTHSKTDTVLTAADLETQTGPSDQAQRNQFEGGAVARFGETEGGFDAWAGVEAMPVCVDLTRVVHGEAKIGLKPFIPVSAVAGIRVISEPLGGPWARRGRLSAGVSGEVGYRVGVTGWLTASL